MKKQLSLLLAIVLFLTLTACQSAPSGTTPVITTLSPPPTETGPAPTLQTIPGQSYSECFGVEVQVEGLLQEAGKTELSVLWKNSTGRQATFGSNFFIERLEKGAWVSCATGEIYFDALAHLLEPNSTRQEVYQLTGIFDVSKPGTYRFRSSVSLQDAKWRSSFSLWAEFSVVLGEDGESFQEPSELPFRARYIRTDGYHEGISYPGVAIIDSIGALQECHQTYIEMYSLSSVYPQGNPPSDDFLSFCREYDEAFFEENYLIFLLLQEGSGSIRHEVTQVLLQPDGRLGIFVQRQIPAVATDDMAQWHVILELERTDRLPTSEMIQVYLDSKLVYAGGIVQQPQSQPFYERPPEGLLTASSGERKLSMAGCSWYAGCGVVIADRAGRPLPRALLENSGQDLRLDPQTAETVFVYVPEKGVYEPTNSLGYLVKLYWERMPDTVTVVCWPDTVWQDANTPEEAVVTHEGEAVVTHENAAFYAKPGCYIYEITATWLDDGSGCHGTAQYYVYLHDQ